MQCCQYTALSHLTPTCLQCILFAAAYVVQILELRKEGLLLQLGADADYLSAIGEQTRYAHARWEHKLLP